MGRTNLSGKDLKYLTSFRTTLRISRYLFRTLALMLWILGALSTAFYILNVFHEKESGLRQDFNLSFDQAQGYIRHATDTMRDIRYIAENRLNWAANGMDAANRVFTPTVAIPELTPLFPESDCQRLSGDYRESLGVLSSFINYWKDNFVAAYDLNRIFFIGGESLCLADFGIRERDMPLDAKNAFRDLHRQILKYQRGSGEQKDNSLFWVVPGRQGDVGDLYVVTPVYVANKFEALLGTEQTLRLEDFTQSFSLPISVVLLNADNEVILRFSENNRESSLIAHLPTEDSYFGYNSSYDTLLLKKKLSPSGMSIVYSVPTRALLEHFNLLLIKAVVFNLLSALVLFILTWLFERKIFQPAENNALRLEENEQFNHKIVASAPVGICILRISDGSNILSNELAHDYITLFTAEDRQRLTQIIREQSTSVVDVTTRRNENLQISFVHSRYRNEDVAICVMVDISARAKMEESLQEMAAAAEQASQSKSMFLATVSHELRTPLYGIIGNLDLLQTKSLPEETQRLLGAMSNSSGLLLKIISDILDFSKIESEQLKIEPGTFVPREVIPHIVGNYLPLVVRKRLALYCFIEPDVPRSLSGDVMRVQQVLSNILNNAIKFTDTGCIILQVRVRGDYLEFRVRDTGVGIPSKDVTRLFDPFFQVGTGVQRHFQGTGLGLAICEKLISLMDGDIAVDSEPGLGSIFTVRIPLYQAIAADPAPPALQGQSVCLDIHNAMLEGDLQSWLGRAGMIVHLYRSGHACPDNAIVITDYEAEQQEKARALIHLSTTYLGHVQKEGENAWVLSTAAPLELYATLCRICSNDAVTVPEQAEAARVEAVVQDNSDISILIVDDHPINRRLLADQLASLGYDSITASDGLDALGVLSKHEIDIVLTDVNMPNMDGYQLTMRLREQGRVAPVIGVTANAMAEERERCIQAGMDSCLSKPVTLDILRQSLKYYAEKTRADKARAAEEKD